MLGFQGCSYTPAVEIPIAAQDKFNNIILAHRTEHRLFEPLSYVQIVNTAVANKRVYCHSCNPPTGKVSIGSITHY